MLEKLLKFESENRVTITLGWLMSTVLGLYIMFDFSPIIGSMFLMIAGVLSGINKTASTSDVGVGIGTLLIYSTSLITNLAGIEYGVLTVILGVLLAFNILNVKGDSK